MSDVLDQFHQVGISLASKLSQSCKKDYDKMSQTAAALAEATTYDPSPGNQKLLTALRVSFMGILHLFSKSLKLIKFELLLCLLPVISPN